MRELINQSPEESVPTESKPERPESVQDVMMEATKRLIALQPGAKDPERRIEVISRATTVEGLSAEMKKEGVNLIPF